MTHLAISEDPTDPTVASTIWGDPATDTDYTLTCPSQSPPNREQ
jgi:hypothetical protein